MPAKRGFSLTELLTVIAIVAIIAAVLFPVFSVAKRRSKVEVSKSYLRQQYIALAIYAADTDDRFPSQSDVINNLRLQAPCSPVDTWSQPCWQRSSPMLGSFGYSGGLSDKDLPVDFRGEGRYPLLADIFTTDYRLAEFAGPAPDLRACLKSQRCDFPERIWFAFSDGSLKVWSGPAPRLHLQLGEKWLRTGFTWPTAFERAMKL
jgi:prepilin-type N-terminal cleavage/methylation domain-containing protein